MRLHIIWIIFRKEITESLRDRVTLLLLIGVPLLLYPLTLLTINGVTTYQAAVEDRQVNTVAVWGVGAAPLLDWITPSTNRFKWERWQNIPASLRREMEAGRLRPPEPKDTTVFKVEAHPGSNYVTLTPEMAPEAPILQAAREVLTRRQADVVLIIWPGYDDAVQRHDLGQVSVYYDSVLPSSALAWSRLSKQLGEFRSHLLAQRVKERQLPEGFMRALDVRGDDVAHFRRQLSNLLGQLLPLILIMLIGAGSLASAVDLTAGEKDRATMQTLLCAPVRSFEIVVGKFLTVWAVSLLAVIAHIAGLGLMLSRITAVMHISLQVVPFGTLLLMCVLLLPASWTIAAFFLAIAALARDVKDAGNFLATATGGVVMLLAVTLLPGVGFDAWTCCVPLVNLALLARILMIGHAPSHLIIIAVLSSLAYASLALALAARIFGREQVMLGGAFSWRWLLLGDKQRPAVPTPGLVLTLFALVAVGMFYVSLSLFKHGVATLLLVTQYGVLLLPVVGLAVARRFPLAETFSLRRPHWRSLLGSVLIGLTASISVAGLVLRLAPPPDSMLRQMQELLHLGDKSTPLWQLWLLIAITPALCEETFMRGLMLSGLRRWGPWAAIGITALLFGVLHGSIYQLLPTFILGLILGYAVWRSGSLYCSILIHALNNGLIATLVWSNNGKEMDVQTIPWNLTLGALVITGIGVALITKPKSCTNTPERSTPP